MKQAPRKAGKTQREAERTLPGKGTELQHARSSTHGTATPEAQLEGHPLRAGKVQAIEMCIQTLRNDEYILDSTKPIWTQIWNQGTKLARPFRVNDDD
eukprot:2320442-Pleurochrysis_carterae.AAC.2